VAVFRADGATAVVPAQVAADLLDIGAAQLWIGGVVGTDGFPRVAEALDVSCEDPGADVDARAGIEEVALADAVDRQRGQPRRVDLHEPDVAGAVAVASDGVRVECGFGAGDRVEQLAADARNETAAASQHARAGRAASRAIAVTTPAAGIRLVFVRNRNPPRLAAEARPSKRAALRFHRRERARANQAHSGPRQSPAAAGVVTALMSRMLGAAPAPRR
jgi:hypothetical protein